MCECVVRDVLSQCVVMVACVACVLRVCWV